MKMEKKTNLLDVLVFTNVWHSLGLTLVTYASFIILGIAADPYPLAATFIISFAIYNLNRTTDADEDFINYPIRANFSKKYGNALFYLSAILCVALFATSLVLSPTLFLILLMLFALGTLYSVKCLPTPKGNCFRLKDLILVKNLVIALCISVGTVLLVVAYPSMHELTPMFYAWFAFVFLMVFINTMVFDLRDIEGDNASDIKTFASCLGIRRTKCFSCVLNTMILLLGLYAILSNTYAFAGYVTVISALYVYAYLYVFGQAGVDNKFLCGVFVDGKYLFVGLLTVMFGLIR